ncbi:MAG: glycosyltransferase family 4 protein [Blastocatellia bacterium]
MRILHMTTEFPPVVFGGLGTAVGGLVNASARAGLSVGVLLAGGVLSIGEGGYGSPRLGNPVDKGPLRGIVGPGGVTFFQVSPFDPVESAVRVAEQWGADLLHLHTAWVWPFAQAILQRTGITLVYTVHSVDRAEYEIGQELGHILEHCEEQGIAISRAERLVALTQNETDLLGHYYPSSVDKIRIVGNGIDDCAKAKQATDRVRNKDSPLVLYTGRLVERKGIRDLLAAIPFVLERAPGTRFVLAGGPPPLSGEEVARQWLPPECDPYRRQIHFTGWLNAAELEDWYCAADIQVVPSRYEPFGMVVLEGMLYGLPIIASALGGPLRILEHGRTGLLYPPKDVSALGEAILRLVTDEDLRRRIGAQAAKEVRRNWLWSRIMQKMQLVYAEALDRHHKPFTPRVIEHSISA